MMDIMLLRTFALGTVLVLALSADCAPALAQDTGLPYRTELRVGVLAHDVPDLWSGFRLESGVDINGEVLFGSGLAVLGGVLRPAIGGSVNTSGGTSKGYIDARWEIEGPAGLFFGTGLGAAVHNGNLGPTDPDLKALGSRVLFHIPIEVGFRFDQRRSISVYFEHTSNAGLANHNEGLDSIGVRYGVRF